MTTERIPTIGELLAPLLPRVPAAHQPILIAAAERMAAERYRDWAIGFTDQQRSAELQACARREDEIAERVEGLFPNAPTIKAELGAVLIEMASITRQLFGGRPLAQQFSIQAAGERLGAATWRSFAKRAEPPARDTFLACAELEERSAEVLEAILRETPDL